MITPDHTDPARLFILSPRTATSIAPTVAGQGFVLFAQLDAKPQPIKVEGTRNLAARVRALDADNPFDVYLIGLIPSDDPAGDAEVLQERFAPARVRGDWFAPSTDVLEVVYNAAQPALLDLLARFQPTSDDASMISVEELARQLSVSVPTVRRMVQAGSIPHVRVGRQIKFVVEDVVASLRRR